MWGNVQEALELDTEHPLAHLLFETTGPETIPYEDERWKLLINENYDLLVHLDPQSNTLIETACQAMARHAVSSSNLAALTLHTSELIMDMHSFMMTHYYDYDYAENSNIIKQLQSEFEQKVRIICGVLNLHRILTHATIESCCSQSTTQQNRDHFPLLFSSTAGIREAFIYRENYKQPLQIPIYHYQNSDTAVPLLDAIISFLSLTDSTNQLLKLPIEFYDANVFALQLFLVLFSTQLYQPMISSAQIQQKSKKKTPPNEEESGCNFFLDKIMSEAYKQNTQTNNTHNWSHSLITSILNWIVKRPKPPSGTISAHYCEIITSIIDTRGEKIGVDGMYQNHLIVHATRYFKKVDNIQKKQYYTPVTTKKGKISQVLNASSALLLIPFRLVKLAMSTIGLIGNGRYIIHDAHKLKMNQNITSHNDAIWLSDSPVADLGCSILLLLQSNYRSNTDDKLLPNPFTMELNSLCDNRWESRRDSMDDYINDDFGYTGPRFHHNDVNEEASTISSYSPTIAINFESLFETFGSILHNEMGALLLYTILQSSPTFYASVAARSDLDTLIMPLIRTLYVSSILIPLPQQSQQNHTEVVIQQSSKMYRSQSQLYVVLILLLLFSQDLSFGPDAFRRVIIDSVPWYKERNLKDISLGSIMILTLLRSITYNLNRSNDEFLISNCCAVLLNLSPHIVNIHTYTAMRLASVTLYCCKRYSVLLTRYQGKCPDADVASILKLYGEVSQTLLQLIRQCLRKEVIEKNLHLIYALVYIESELNETLNVKSSPFKKSDVDLIISITSHACKFMKDAEKTLTVADAMERLQHSVQSLVSIPLEESNLTEETPFDDKRKLEMEPDFSYTYEEEADPEVFFVPYVWEVIVCVITSSSLDWNRSQIKVSSSITDDTLSINEKESYVKDAAEVV